MSEKLLDKNTESELREIFNTQMVKPVQMVFFGSKTACDYCEETLQLSQEVADLSKDIYLNRHDLDQEPELASEHKVDKAPTIVVAAIDDGKVFDYGIRFAGIPAGHEFASFIQAIIMVSRRDSNLTAETREFLQQLREPLHLQVFVTPT